MNADEQQQLRLLLYHRLGEALVNRITASRLLRHATVAGQAPYIDDSDPATAVLSAFGRGRLDDAADALAAYLADPQDALRRIVEEREQGEQLRDVLSRFGAPA